MMKSEITHIPVLLREVLEFLSPKQNQTMIDGTVGQGGHALAIVERLLPDGRLLCIDRDPTNLATAKERLNQYQKNVVFAQDSFANIKKIAYVHGLTSVSGILLDLGFSTAHLEDAGRGFSFQREGPLDMRYDPNQILTAAGIVNEWSKEDLAKIFRQYGEELQAEKGAVAIVQTRASAPLRTTAQLAELVASVIRRRGKIHPATRVFQALRIAVNDELGQLRQALPDMLELLAPGGRLAIISFHSLEDRIVKDFFKTQAIIKIKQITKRIVTPEQEEIFRNPRARSAKLRVVERLD